MAPTRWLPFVLLAGCAPSEPMPDAPLAPPSAVLASSALPSPEADARGVAYGPDHAQQLDLFLPAKPSRGLIVFVHGGAWLGGSRHEFDAAAARLRQMGLAAATVDYRLSPGVRHPAHAEDVAHALAWLRAHAAQYHYSGSRIVAVGHSAGGHILGSIATDPKLFALARPAGFVGLEGIYDVPDLARRWPAYPDWFLKKAFGPEAGWAAASPTRRTPATKAPWLLVHSKGDELVDPGQRDAFAAHLRKSGVRVQTLTPEGETHDGVVQGLARPDDAVTKAILTFASGR